MSPSTNTPQAAFRRPNPGTYTCMVCVPTVHDKGGQGDFYTHYNREHATTPQPAGKAT